MANNFVPNPSPLRMARLAAGMSQDALGRRVGFPARTISELERGIMYAPLPSDKAEKIAAVLNVRSVDDIFKVAG